MWQEVGEESVGFVARQRDDALGVRRRRFFRWVATSRSAFRQLGVCDGRADQPRSGPAFVHRRPAGRIPGAEQRLGDGDRGLLGYVAAAGGKQRNPGSVQQWIGFNQRNDRRPECNSDGGSGSTDLYVYRNAESRWLDHVRLV